MLNFGFFFIFEKPKLSNLLNKIMDLKKTKIFLQNLLNNKN